MSRISAYFRLIIPLTAGPIKKTYSVLTGQVRPKMPKKR
jgi:hypothetical protein